MLRAHLEEEPLRIKGVPRPVWDVLASMLEKSPARRPSNAAVAARALEGALARSGDLRPREPRDEDTWERAGTKVRLDDVPTGDTAVGAGARDGDRHLAGVAAAGALNTTKAAHAGPGGGYGPGGYDDWDADAATGLIPPVAGPAGLRGGHWDDDAATRLGPSVGGPSGPRGGRWDDDAPTRLGPPVGGPPGGWDDEDGYEDPPTAGQPVRIPGRAGAVQANRNTIISAIPASKQPTPAVGRPPARTTGSACGSPPAPAWLSPSSPRPAAGHWPLREAGRRRAPALPRPPPSPRRRPRSSTSPGTWSTRRRPPPTSRCGTATR